MALVAASGWDARFSNTEQAYNGQRRDRPFGGHAI